MGAVAAASICCARWRRSRGAGYLMTVDPARVRTAPGGLSRDAVERSASCRSRPTRSAAAWWSRARRRCRAWRSPCCARSSVATVEPLLVGDDVAAALLEAYGTTPAARARRSRASSRSATPPSASRWRSPRAGRAACSRCAASPGSGSASTAARRPKKSSCRRARSGSRTAPRTATWSRRRARHGRRHLHRTERAADPARRSSIASRRTSPTPAPPATRPSACRRVESRRPDFGQVLQTAIDVAAAPGLIDFRDGSDRRPPAATSTSRSTAAASSWSRRRRARATRATASSRAGRTARWSPPTATSCRATAAAPIVVGPGRHRLRAGRHGPRRRRAGRQAQDRRLRRLRRPAPRGRRASAPRPATTPTAAPTTSRVLGGALEESNVPLAERMVQLTEVSRAFEALQRGITMLMNDVDGRAITELGRR